MEVIAIVGATATGKTALGVRLAQAWDGEVINADALQVYRGLDIGTGKPTHEERAGVTHHLLDFLDPREPFSAGAFVQAAVPVLEDIAGRGRLPIVVGGSGLYLRALFEGLSPIPAVPSGVRERLDIEHARLGLEALYDRLDGVDPVTAKRLAPGDSQRILRALAVAEGTGRPLSDWQALPPVPQTAIEPLRIGLTLPRSILYDRIAGRVREMLRRGWVEEVEALLDVGIEPGAHAFQAIGYRQIVAFLSGTMTLEEAIEDIIRATRRYAKRQETWFRKEPAVEWIPALDTEAHIPSLLRSRDVRRKLVE